MAGNNACEHLDFDLQNIDLFLNTAKPIANKKSCLLIQFPGSIKADYNAPVEWILRRLQVLDPQNQWRKAIEFRSVTWYNNQTHELLHKYGASIVLHDMPKSKNFVLTEGAQFIYCRFHGPSGDYRGSYSNDFLEEQSVKIRRWLNDGKDVYAYFNNTIGNAFENAMTLKGMVEK